MTKEEIQEYADSLSINKDRFSQWACKHIQSSYLEWEEIMNPADCSLQGTMSNIYQAIGIELDYYWLLECRDHSELTLLLRSWYDKRHSNAYKLNENA